MKPHLIIPNYEYYKFDPGTSKFYNNSLLELSMDNFVDRFVGAIEAFNRIDNPINWLSDLVIANQHIFDIIRLSV